MFLDDRWIQHHAPGENEPAVEGAVEKLVGEVVEGEEDGRLGDDDVEERTYTNRYFFLESRGVGNCMQISRI